jgi:hypothetical protein
MANRLLILVALIGLMLLPVGLGAVTSGSEQLKTGAPFPALKGSLLTGRSAALPAIAAGKVSLVAIGFTYGSRKPVEAWAAWFHDAFADEPNTQLFEVPIIGGFAKLGKWFIDSGMRSGTPAAMHDHVMTVYSGSGDWKARLGFTEAGKDDAYLVLLDRAGLVRWQHHGPFDAARAKELDNEIDRVIGG